MENEKLLDLMTKMYSEMQEGFSNVNDRLDKVELRLDKVENVVTTIEHTHGHKLEALFDSYIQNSQQLDRIEEEVSQHEAFILNQVR